MTPLTGEGYAMILRLGEAEKTEAFIERLVREDLNLTVPCDREALRELQRTAANPPDSMYELRSALANATWLGDAGAGDAPGCSQLRGARGEGAGSPFDILPFD